MDLPWILLVLAVVASGILGGVLARIRSRVRGAEQEVARITRLAQEEQRERREAEEQLRRAQRMETVGQLVGGMAHETNNQMMVVLNFIEFLSRGNNLTEEQKKDLGTVGEAAERVSALTRQVLGLSRRQVRDTRVLDLDSVVAEAESVLRRTLGPEIRLSLQLEPGQKWILADRNQLVQVMVNLALNARDAMPASGELTISTRQSDRGPSGGRLGNTWPATGVALLSIADSGTGIDPAVLSRIFEPFYSTKPSGERSGLGLPVVEGIVAQAGGDIWVESKPGYGTVVTVGLPLVAAPSQEERQLSQANGSRGSERILVVDDEEQVRRLLVRGLEQGEYDVIEAAGGQEAIAILEQENGRVQRVVTDIAMPVMNGVELADRINATWPSLPILFVSGHPYDVVALKRDAFAADRFLQKPFKVDTLLAEVRQALDRVPRS
jgi:signal transduction histidine kinase/ActR/RegA family two-component response regulator